jgi:DNA uptake lipoprotein
MDKDVLREFAMKRGIDIRLVVALALAGGFGVLPAHGQQPNSGAGHEPAPAAQQPKPQQDSNPFPTDTTDVPVLPSNENPAPNVPRNVPTANAEQVEDTSYPLAADSDPVASPDDAAGLTTDGSASSSSSASLDSLLPSPGDDDTKKRGKRDSDVLEGMPKETAAQDISVAKYYLDKKNWRAALSRFQSALVLAPEDPEVYWGLAVSQQHVGDFAHARENYLKVIEYDPDSKHAKDARKALKEPELANAKPAQAAGQPQE